MSKGILYDATLCIGCKMCEKACAEQHGLPYDDRVTAEGVGAYIAQATAVGDYPKIVLGVAAMSIVVIVINRLFWRRLSVFAENRLRLL